MKPLRILETCLYVDDLDAARWFYGSVLGLEQYSLMPGRHVFFRCADAMLLLFRAEQTLQTGAGLPTHGSSGPGHVAFACTHDDIPQWQEGLRKAGIAVELDHHWPNGARSLYFRDPAGNSVELATPGLWELN